MKRILIVGAVAVSLGFAGPALAADLPVKGPIAAPALFNWTGFYVGGHVGFDWFDKDWFTPLTPINIVGGCPLCPASAGGHTDSGWLAGGQIGFNHQVGSFVWGVEAQLSATKLEASNPNALAPGFITDHSKTDWVATLAARFGWAWDRLLVYGKVGGAWAHDKYWTSTIFVFPVAQAVTDTRSGWMGGIGLEYALMPNWSLKMEYDYLSFGRRRETLGPTPGCLCIQFQYDIKQTIQLVKVGVNYRFGWPL